MLRLGRAASAALRCSGAQSRYYSDATKTITATLFPGDGIGPEIADAVKQVSIRRAAPGPLPCTPGAVVWHASMVFYDTYNHRRPQVARAGVPRCWSSHRVGRAVCRQGGRSADELIRDARKPGLRPGVTVGPSSHTPPLHPQKNFVCICAALDATTQSSVRTRRSTRSG